MKKQDIAAIVVIVLMVVSNVLLVMFHAMPRRTLIGVVLLLIVESLKIFVILKRFDGLSGKSSGTAVLLVETLSFMMAAIVVVGVGKFPEMNGGIAVALCVDFMMVRASSCCVLTTRL